jgi:hypothetical protein
MTLLEKHIELTEAVNNSATEYEHRMAQAELDGFRLALDCLGHNGQQYAACDMYYINKGIDRPMCCGVFLDWEPTDES